MTLKIILVLATLCFQVNKGSMGEGGGLSGLVTRTASKHVANVADALESGSEKVWDLAARLDARAEAASNSGSVMESLLIGLRDIFDVFTSGFTIAENLATKFKDRHRSESKGIINNRENRFGDADVIEKRIEDLAGVPEDNDEGGSGSRRIGVHPFKRARG